MKGVGSRLLRRHGWQEGQGVGKRPGIREPIEAEGHAGRVRYGIGYRAPAGRPAAASGDGATVPKRARGNDRINPALAKAEDEEDPTRIVIGSIYDAR